MNLIETILNSNLIYALGWTLIHSFWQIIIIGLTLRILLFLFKDQSSNLKYTLSVSAYSLIMIVSVITFFDYYNFGNSNISSEGYIFPTEFSRILSSQTSQTDSLSDSGQSIFSIVGLLISSNIHLIVGIWFVGLIIFYFRMAGSYWYVQRLKTRNLFPLNNEWNSILYVLKQKLQINKIISIAESTTIQIPMVIGHLKPIILLPIGMISSLPYNQVEAILLHELAHIKRNDYIVNLVKSMVEIVFFYHPVAWWISSKIDDEREHCCDDLTIQICSEKSSLQNALLNIHELNQESIYIAAALFKNKHQLLKRIKRMKTQHQKKQKKFNGLAAISILLISVAILTTFSAFSPTQSDLPIDFQNTDILLDESLFTNEEPLVENLIINEPDQSNSIVLSVPDSTQKTEKEKDSDQDVDSDKDIDEDIDEDKELEKELERAEKELEKAEIEIDRAMEVYDRAMIDYHKTLSKTKNLNDIEAWTISDENYKKAMALAELQLEHLDIEIPEIEEMQIAEIIEDHMEILEEWSMEEQLEMSNDLFEDALELKELETELLSAEMEEQLSMIQDQLNDQLAEFEEVLADQMEELDDIRELEFDAQLLETEIKSELVRDRLIENKEDDLSFTLSAKKLEVNGKICSEELHQKYLELYEDITDEKLKGTTRLIFQD